MNKLDNINYRILNADEFDREDLINIFESERAYVPNPLVSHIQIAEKDGKIIGLAVLQPQYHAEPIWVHPEYRDTILHKSLIESLLNPLKNLKNLRVFIFAPNSKIVALAERFGFRERSYTVMERTF